MKVLASILIVLFFFAGMCSIAGAAWFAIQGNWGYVVGLLLSTYLLWVLMGLLVGLAGISKA